MSRREPHNRFLRTTIGSLSILGVASVTLSCAMGSLGAPTGLTGTAADGAVDLAWEPAGEAVGYRVLMHTESGLTETVYTEARETGTTALRWSGLSNGATYYFAVAAVGIDGVGPVSGEIDVVPQAPPTGVVRDLDPPTAFSGGLYGFDVATDGDFVVVGAPFYEVDGFESGAVFVYRRVDGGWSEPAVLSPPSPKGAELFGISVDISGNTIVVGASGWMDAFFDQLGRAFVYERSSGNSWEYAGALSAGFSSEPGAEFGRAVAVAGDYVAVGAPAEDENGSTAGSGAVYVFRRTSTGWSSGLRVTRGAQSPAAGDAFGTSVDLDGDYLLVGAPSADYSGFINPGTAEVFRRTGENSWDHSGVLIASDALTDEGTFAPGNERFGDSVAIDGQVLVVGAPYDSEFSLRSGAVHVYYRVAEDGYSSGYKLLAPDASSGAWFGIRVAAGYGMIAVGAPQTDLPGTLNAGTVYRYEDEGNGLFVHPTRLQSRTPTVNGGFGSSVALGANGLLVGEPYAQAGATNAGDAWVFE